MLRHARLIALASLSWMLGACAHSESYRVAAGTTPAGALPVNPKGMGFLVEEGHRLIRGLGWVEPEATDAKTRAAADGRARDAAAALLERFRSELESRWAATPHDAALPRCSDGSTQCWMWVDTCTLRSGTIVDRFDEAGMAFAIDQIDLDAFRVCIGKQHSLAAPEADFVLGNYAPVHAALAGADVAEVLRQDLEARWQRYRAELTPGKHPRFDAGGAPPREVAATAPDAERDAEPALESPMPKSGTLNVK